LKLEDTGKTVRYIEFKDGGHNLAIQQNRTLFFEELDAFLAKHLGVVEP
jgi:dipeptidyl aminopeptidase/acylaminoacyl peptidase